MNHQPESFQLPQITAWQKARLLKAAERVLLAQQQMISPRGKNILHYTLKRNPRHKQYKHYPRGDRVDTSTGAQFFYHCHREDESTTEHGHFHCFMRYQNIAKHIKPKRLKDWDKYIDNPMVHLVAVAMNQIGQPIRLFTVNRWVTSETWFDARHMPHLLRQFKMTVNDDPYWQVLDQWITGVLQLFSPQITWLYQQRDQCIEKYKVEHPVDNIYECIDLEELSQISVNLTQQIQWIIESPV